MTLLSRFLENVHHRAKKPALHYFKNGNKFTLNWRQVYDYIESYYQGLLEHGVKPGDSIVLYSNTCKEWGFLDLAILATGAKTIPVYHSSHMDDVSYILEHCEADFIFVENQTLYNKLITTERFKNGIKNIFCINEFDSTDKNLKFLKDLVTTQTHEDFKTSCKKVDIDTDATVIYTSGTSGTPKGVVLTHKQILSAVSEVFPLLGVTHNDCSLTFLPFSHIFGRMELWGSYFCGYTLGYAESIDKIKKNLPQIQPTVLVGVPRIFEKIYYGILAQIDISPTKQKVFYQALKIGNEMNQYRKQKKSPPLLLSLKYRVAHRLVFSNIHQRLGGKLRFALSGGAPLDPGISDFFEACGLSVLEGYGLTETTGPVYIHTLFASKVGTVGKPIGDVQARLDSDGEVLIKSDKVMKEYYKNPEQSKEVMTEDGYFRTGDIGEIDSEGFLKITDRKKDLIKTAGGKFIAPQKLQNFFAKAPLIGHVHVHGDKEKYVVALITLEKDTVLSMKKKLSLEDGSLEKLSQDPKIVEKVRIAVSEVNQRLASFETIKRYTILNHEFTVDGGQLTPSLKMKRKKIDELYKNDIKKLYS